MIDTMPTIRFVFLAAIAVAAVVSTGWASADWGSTGWSSTGARTTAPVTSGEGQSPVRDDSTPEEQVSPVRRPKDNPDPFLVTDDDRYLAYFTQGGSNVPLRTSTDGQKWSKPVDVLPELPAWARPGRTWAPGVLSTGDGLVLYFTAWHAASGRQCIGAGTAETPYGPFEPAGSPLVCQLDLGGSIDPSPFRDDSGSYLLWKSDENAVGRAARLWAAMLGPAGTTLAGEPVELLRTDQSWEAPLIENPAMVAGEDGRLWLFYSAGPWESDRYATGLASCVSPLGPCDKLSVDAPWLETDGDLVGPGGLETFRSSSGQRMAALHAWDPDAIGYRAGGERSLRIGHLDLSGSLPVFHAPATLELQRSASNRGVAAPTSSITWSPDRQASGVGPM